MPKGSPFSGLKLSGQAPPSEPGLDQRLFSQAAPPTERRPEAKTPAENQETGKLARRETGKEFSHLGGRVVGHPFDLGERPYRKDSFLFTHEEHEALEDIKIELRRKFDIATTKNELVRCALHQLLEDFRRAGEGSIVLRRLLSRRTR